MKEMTKWKLKKRWWFFKFDMKMFFRKLGRKIKMFFVKLWKFFKIIFKISWWLAKNIIEIGMLAAYKALEDKLKEI